VVRGKLHRGEPSPAIKLESLKLTNFRGFRELEISFDPSFAVLLGENMAGRPLSSRHARWRRRPDEITGRISTLNNQRSLRFVLT